MNEELEQLKEDLNAITYEIGENPEKEQELIPEMEAILARITEIENG